jgi:predicted CXXCH cytochrome family protein
MFTITVRPRTLVLAGLVGFGLLATMSWSIRGATTPPTADQAGRSHKMCLTCHNGEISGAPDVAGDFEKSSKHPYYPENSNASCVPCHNSDGVEDPSSGLIYPQLLQATDASGNEVYSGNAFCGACHGVGSAQIGGDHLTDFLGTKHDLETAGAASGTGIKCVSCHNQHGSEIRPMLRETIEGRPVTANDSSLCGACHTGAVGSYAGDGAYAATEHGAASGFDNTWPISGEAGLASGGPAAGSCTNCHNPHGKTDAQGPIPNYNLRREETLCYGDGQGCHSGANSESGINIYQRFNLSSNNTAKHNVDGAQPGAKVECTGCHNPHLTNRAAKTIDPNDKNQLFSPPPTGLGGGIARVEERHSSVAYAGSWATESNAYENYSDRGRRYSSSAGASATFNFNSTSVTWISSLARGQGIAAVYLDGIFQQNVDLYAFTREYQREVFRANGLSAGPHTLKIVVTGTKNPAATGHMVTVDAFEFAVAGSQTVDYMAFCNRCHDNVPPSGTAIPLGLTDIADSYTRDFHGEGAGSPSWTEYDINFNTYDRTKAPLKAPFGWGADAITCQVCHDQHGSANVFHFNETVNGKAVSVTSSSGQDAYSLCSSCHTGTVDDFHAECLSCHGDWSHDLGAPYSFAGRACFDCHRHGRENWRPYDNPGDCSMYDCHPSYRTF